MKTRFRHTSLTCLSLILAGCAGSKDPAHESTVQPTEQALTHARGSANDLVADVEVGRRDFTELSVNEIAANGLNNPGGVAIDRSVSPGRAYVWDSGNSRILGYDLSQCYATPVGSRCTAQKVFGQPSLSDYGACNRDSSATQFPNRPAASASTLCGVSEVTHTVLEDKSGAGMFVDGSGNLWVTDVYNHRVLRYNSPFTTDTVADAVWGQANFTSNGCNRATSWTSVPAPTAFSLCFINQFGVGDGAGVRLDAAGNLWVADGGNNRVLRFSKSGSTIATTADIVLGQSSFTSSTAGNALNQLSSPQGLVFDSAGTLYVSDSGNHRVLVFRKNGSGQFVTGQSAASMFGTFPTDQYGPGTLELDPQGRGIWTTHFQDWDSIQELWDLNGNRVSSVPAVDYWGNSTGSIAFDAQNNMLLTSYLNTQLVLYSLQPDGSYGAERDLFGASYDANIISSRRFSAPGWAGVGVADHVVSTKQLIVAAGRLMFWNNPSSITLGQAPTGCVGSSDCLKTTDTYSELKVDATDRVWVATGNQVQVFQAPLTTASTPLQTLTGAQLLGTGTMVDLTTDALGIAVSPDGQCLWVSQASLNRVVRVRNPLGASPIVDVVLGQTSIDGNQANQGAGPTLSTLAVPGAIALDRFGNLFVSDHMLEIAGNQRLLMFSASTFPANRSNVIYAPAATKEFPTSNPSLPYTMATFEPAFDASNRMVVGLNPYSIGYDGWYPNNLIQRYPIIFDNPLTVNPSNPSDPAYAVPTGRLEDFYGWAVAATFDSSNNLYMFDANRGRVNVYYAPFGVPTTSVQGQYKNYDLGAPNDNVIKPGFNLVNAGTSAIPLTEITIRYYMSSESSTPTNQNYWVDYAAIGADNVRGRFVAASCTGTDVYFEVSFVGGTLAASSQTGEIQTRASKPDWSAYNESNDYSYIANQLTFANSNKITVYRNGTRISGSPPSGCN